MQEKNRKDVIKQRTTFTHPRNHLSGICSCCFNERQTPDRNPRGKEIGFTLIELLVVVLIIGILAAVAVPQYQKAVEKSRAATVLSLLKAVGQAQETYKMANGEYATSFDELSVDVPWTGNTKWYTSEDAEKDTRSNADWSIALKQVTGTVVSMGRISGPYAGVGFIYILESGVVPTGTILCTEQKGGGINYGGAKGSYCQKIMRAGQEIDGGNARYTWYL